MFDRFEEEAEPPDPGDEAEAELVPTVRDPSENIDDPSENVEPTVPSIRDYSSVDADPELAQEFWIQVFLFNIALFAVSLGLMLIGFRQRWTFGGALLVVGIVAFARGFARYRSFQKD